MESDKENKIKRAVTEEEMTPEEYRQYYEELQKQKFRKAVQILILLGFITFFFIHAYWPTSINSVLADPIVFETPLFSADVIVVFGAGTDKEGNPLQTERISRAVELYKQGLASKILFTGGKSKYGYIESESMQKYAVSLGVKEEDMILEKEALNTYENAKNSFEIIKNNKFEKIILVTTCYHTRRAFASFQNFQKDNLMITYDHDCWIYRPGIFNRWVGLKEILREFVANTYYDYKYSH